MKLRILRGARAGARDRGVIALTADNGAWVMINVSAAVALDLGERTHDGAPSLSSLAGVVLTDAHVDHAAGLLNLRAESPVELFATPSVFENLTGTLPMLPVLDHRCGVRWHMVPVAGDCRVAPFQVAALPTLAFTAIATDTPPVPYATRDGEPSVGDTIALIVRDQRTGQSVFCAPGLSQIGAQEFDWMRDADCLLMDAPSSGTLAEMDSISAELLSDLPARHKVLWAPPHAANPSARSPKALTGRGIEWAYDGLEITL